MKRSYRQFLWYKTILSRGWWHPRRLIHKRRYFNFKYISSSHVNQVSLWLPDRSYPNSHLPGLCMVNRDIPRYYDLDIHSNDDVDIKGILCIE